MSKQSKKIVIFLLNVVKAVDLSIKDQITLLKVYLTVWTTKISYDAIKTGLQIANNSQIYEQENNVSRAFWNSTSI